MIRSAKQYRAAILIILMFLTAACSQQDGRKRASELAKRAGFVARDLQTDTFLLRTLSKTDPTANILRVYIEGDGFAWVTRNQPSSDPTPRNPTGLKLAAADPSSNVLYLARPCQYIGPPLPASCRTAWWTEKRFSLPVVMAMDEALSQFVVRMPGVQLELVGYSGGATIAAQIAARRHDVRSLRTVAGNLDVAFVNEIHQVSAMPDALSAMDVAAQLASLPQIHFSGAQDRIVPLSVAERFQQATGTRCTKVEQVAGMQHGSDWAAIWPQLLVKTPECSG